MSIAKKTKTSGEHNAVQAFRAKLDSISATTLPLAKELNERIERARRTNNPALTTGPHRPASSPQVSAHDEDDTDPVIVVDISDLDELE